MASINAIHQQEAALVAVLKEAASRLAAVGTTEVSAALTQLQQAADAAKARLEAASHSARKVFSTLAADAGNVASSLSADLFGTARGVVQVEAPGTPTVAVTTTVDPKPAAEQAEPRADDDDGRADETQLPHPADNPPVPDTDQADEDLARVVSAEVTPIAADDARPSRPPVVTVAANAPVGRQEVDTPDGGSREGTQASAQATPATKWPGGRRGNKRPS